MPDTRNDLLVMAKSINDEFSQTPEEALAANQLPDKESAALVYHGEVGDGGRSSVRVERDKVGIVAADKSTGAIFDGINHTTSLYGAQISLNSMQVFWGLSQLNPLLKLPIVGWAAQYQPVYVTLTAIPAVTEVAPGPDPHVHPMAHTHNFVVKPLPVFDPEVLGLAKFAGSLGKFAAEALKIVKGVG